MANTWKEVEQAATEKRCELVLSGPVISKRIEENGLDYSIFRLTNLNFLEISNTFLETLPDDIAGLANLTRLVLRGNRLQSVSNYIGSLRKLKFLDLSDNKLIRLPSELNFLKELISLNVGSNCLTELPNISDLKHVIMINFAKNNLTEFPASLCQLSSLIEVIGNGNQIETISSHIGSLSALKTLDLSSNAITVIPGELGDCTKLKELNLKENPIKDKRLLKLIEQCHCKQVLEYVRSHCAKDSGDSTSTKAGKQSAKDRKKRKEKKSESAEEIDQLQDRMKVLHVSDETPVVISTPAVKDVRSCIICCIIKEVDLSKPGVFRKFITLQTKLHDTACEKRNLATIATHDLKKITPPITFDARIPSEIKIVPLGKKKSVTALDLYNQLTEEAEALRKEKKRNVYSGIHKYLYLLKDKPLYPCVTDGTGHVISLPPLTNSEVTKISEETSHILVEVTGNAFADCKKVMEALLLETLKLNIGKKEDPDLAAAEDHNSDTDDTSVQKPCLLLLEQVRITDPSGQLKTVYPSRTDLKLDGVIINRD